MNPSVPSPPMTAYFVRIGSQGEVSTCLSEPGGIYRRGQSVVCQTARGTFIGTVLNRATLREAGSTPSSPPERIIRSTRPEDEWLKNRLEQFKPEAIQRCRTLLEPLAESVTLVDVEQSLDGQNLLFYFLEEVSPQVETLTARLAEEYQLWIRRESLTDLLEQGCGPGCGTSQAKGGCGTKGACATCQACHVKKSG